MEARQEGGASSARWPWRLVETAVEDGEDVGGDDRGEREDARVSFFREFFERDRKTFLLFLKKKIKSSFSFIKFITLFLLFFFIPNIEFQTE